MFEILDIEDKFIEIITADYFPSKPNPSSITYIMEKYDFKNDEILMLGDSKVDMEYGSYLRASIGVLCGAGSKEMLSQYQII